MCIMDTYTKENFLQEQSVVYSVKVLQRSVQYWMQWVVRTCFCLREDRYLLLRKSASANCQYLLLLPCAATCL